MIEGKFTKFHYACPVFSRNASELKAADILMITVLLHNIFPHSKQAIPLTLNRTPPPLAHPVIQKGGPSMSHHILSGSHTQGGPSMQGQRSRPPRHSDPVDIDQSLQNANVDTDDLYPGSSVEDEFYSPRSSPAPMSPMNNRAEAASPESAKTPVMPKERFFTPRAPTPEYLRKMVNSHLDCNKSVKYFTAPFNYMWTLNFNPNKQIAFFTAVDHNYGDNRLNHKNAETDKVDRNPPIIARETTF